MKKILGIGLCTMIGGSAADRLFRWQDGIVGRWRGDGSERQSLQ